MEELKVQLRELKKQIDTAPGREYKERLEDKLILLESRIAWVKAFEREYNKAVNKAREGPLVQHQETVRDKPS